MSEPANPIYIVVREPSLERPSRWMTFFRWLFLFPHFVWISVWGVAIVCVLPVLWVSGLIHGRNADWLQRFYGAFVRYYVQLYAYMSFAADAFPGFDGRPGYAVEVMIPPSAAQSRWSIVFRLFLALPPLLLASALIGGSISGGDFRSTSGGGSSSADLAVQGGSFGLLTLIAVFAWWACICTKRMPRGLRDLAVYALGYGAQAWGYFFLLTGRFPDATPALANPLPQPPHPVRAGLDDDLRRSRLTVLFRGLLFLPHLVWLVLWGLVVFLAVIVSWFATLFAGRSPAALHRFVAAYVRYAAHVTAFVTLVANPFPGFVGAVDSYPLTVTVDPRARQNRWKTGFRLILVIPAALLASALSGAATFAAVGGWCFALIMGRMPRGLRDLNAFSVRYGAQHWSYVLLLTDRYPYGGPTLETEEPRGPWLPPAPPEAGAWMAAPEAV